MIYFLLQDRLQSPGVVADEFAHDRQLNAVQFLIEILQGNGEAIAMFVINGVRGRLDPAGNKSHDVNDGGEEQRALVLLHGHAVEELIYRLSP